MQKRQITVVYGENPREMVTALLTKLKPEAALPREATIGLKPNLVLDKPASSGATTHPELVEGIIQYFQSKGYAKLIIMESSWIGARTEQAFQVCGYRDLAAKYGLKLLDLKKDQTVKKKVEEEELTLCATPLGVDYLINLPVLKAHCQTKLTCALKNLKGCIPDQEKRRFHRLGLHRPIAQLAAALPVDLTIVDGICGDLTFEEGGNPVPMGRLIAGTDPVLLDTYAAALLGMAATEIPYLTLAAALGVGTTDLTTAEVVEVNPEAKTAGSFRLAGRAERFARYVQENEACSACYGSLIHALHRLEEEGELKRVKAGAFPIKIGQGFRGQAGSGIGIGNCTGHFAFNLPGCPPRALEIKAFLQRLLGD
ncbi:MAG TPA: DUF362 domain-containing protein [Firmicutes bacterium]|jgi:uncharacterized protein (DUF362 family)|nr:DUF362 domain-containing protein [Bacillota bacterium]